MHEQARTTKEKWLERGMRRPSPGKGKFEDPHLEVERTCLDRGKLAAPGVRKPEQCPH